MQSSTSSALAAPFGGPALATNLAGFAFNGVLMGIYGPMIETLALRFHVMLATAGALVGIHFLGALIGAAAFWQLRRFKRPNSLLRQSYAMLALGFVMILIATIVTSFPLLCSGVLASGVGFGGLDYGLSGIFASGYHDRKTEMLNLLHGSFGIGTALGPLALGLIGVARYPAVFMAGFVIAVAGILIGSRGRVVNAFDARKVDDEHALSKYPLISFALMLFVFLYLVHVAVQGSIGEWEPTQLRTHGFHTQAASLWTAAYWFGIAASRLCLAYGRIKFAPQRTVLVCCAGTVACSALAFVPTLQPVAYVLFGFFIGPIFPVGLGWLSEMLHQPDDGIAAVVITSLVGGVIFPPLIGVIISDYGVVAFPFALLALSLCAVLLAWMLQRQHPATIGRRTQV